MLKFFFVISLLCFAGYPNLCCYVVDTLYYSFYTCFVIFLFSCSQEGPGVYSRLEPKQDPLKPTNIITFSVQIASAMVCNGPSVCAVVKQGIRV